MTEDGVEPAGTLKRNQLRDLICWISAIVGLMAWVELLLARTLYPPANSPFRLDTVADNLIFMLWICFCATVAPLLLGRSWTSKILGSALAAGYILRIFVFR